MAVATRSAESVTTEQVWHELEKASFAVIAYVTPQGEPRSSGVVFKALNRRVYIAVAPDSWKSRHIAAAGQVSATVLVPRGGPLSLMMPIPPATISFHAGTIAYRASSPALLAVLDELKPLLPVERRDNASIIEITPRGEFLTYGIGVSLMEMRHPATARARVPVGRPSP